MYIKYCANKFKPGNMHKSQHYWYIRRVVIRMFRCVANSMLPAICNIVGTTAITVDKLPIKRCRCACNKSATIATFAQSFDHPDSLSAAAPHKADPVQL
jgi:hypothetical protein